MYRHHHKPQDTWLTCSASKRPPGFESVATPLWRLKEATTRSVSATSASSLAACAWQAVHPHMVACAQGVSRLTHETTHNGEEPYTCADTHSHTRTATQPQRQRQRHSHNDTATQPQPQPQPHTPARPRRRCLVSPAATPGAQTGFWAPQHETPPLPESAVVTAAPHPACLARRAVRRYGGPSPGHQDTSC